MDERAWNRIAPLLRSFVRRLSLLIAGNMPYASPMLHTRLALDNKATHLEEASLHQQEAHRSELASVLHYIIYTNHLTTLQEKVREE